MGLPGRALNVGGGQFYARTPNVFQKSGDGLAEHGMHEVRRDLGQRNQDKGAFVQPRVRDRYPGLINDGVCPEEDVEIDYARAVTLGALTPEIGFDLEHRPDQPGRVQLCPQRHNLIQVARLGVLHAPGTGLIHGRHRPDGASALPGMPQSFKGHQGELEVVRPVSADRVKVGTEAYVG